MLLQLEIGKDVEIIVPESVGEEMDVVKIS